MTEDERPDNGADDEQRDHHTLADPWKDPTVLRKLYLTEDKTQQEIADRFGVTQPAIQYWLDAHGISKDDNADMTPREIKRARRRQWGARLEA